MVMVFQSGLRKMRHAARVDANQGQVVSALLAAGAIVEVIGLPTDLLVGFRWKLFLLEVKDGAKVKSAQKKTPLQERIFSKFAGYPVKLVDSPESALRAIGAINGNAV